MKSGILEIKNLHVEFSTYGGIVKSVRGLDLSLQAGETLAIVGESGCGKSVMVQSILGLIPMPPGKISQGSARLEGKELIGLSIQELNKIRGKDIGFIFQDPMTALNPTLTIGYQISESLKVHYDYSFKKARQKAIELLTKVQIPDAANRVDQYPFQLSGGMRQRVMIAIAIACEPKILIADEPTTALDVTIQNQILNLLKELQAQNKMSLILITHDLGVVAKMADQVAVMYAGQIVEKASVYDIFNHSEHPYTMGLKNALPSEERERKKLIPIEGAPPDLFYPPKACAYYDRCSSALKICQEHNPPFFRSKKVENHISRCWLAANREGQI